MHHGDPRPRLRLQRCHALRHRGGLRPGLPREALGAVAGDGEVAAEREGTATQETGTWKPTENLTELFFFHSLYGITIITMINHPPVMGDLILLYPH